ncbi:MAG: GMP reductase [Gammaproteobacteria bacterium RIFCSPHIGHO2_12_FULL_41_15]|nr:MAG: GMP reductase [Gammaproteobacteria bacterium RIFCSPHIGHO2_12_FULL_41_15]
MHIDNDLKLAFKDVLIRPKRSKLKSRSEVDIIREYTFCHSQQKWSGVPIIAANMDHTGTLQMAKVLGKHKLMTALSKFISLKDWQTFHSAEPTCIPYTFLSSGTRQQDFEHMQATLSTIDIPFICLDVANGYSEHFVDFVKRVRDTFPNKTIMAGNVVTGEMTEELILAGADIVKVGIGPGSVCTTRKQTGVGYPQLSAVIECADAAHGLKGLVCSDGGCTVPGDVAKAFGGGADFVMLGGMLSGHDECLGEVFEKNNKSYKRFYGMSSSEAMNRYHGKVAEYRSSEGKSVDVPYRGPVETTILDLLGGIRSTCTYVGAEKLKELSKRTTFIRVNIQLNEIFSKHEID